MKALVIGRHTDAIPGVEIVELRPVTFPGTADECAAVIRALWKEVEGRGVKLLFQNLPGQVGVALARLMRDNPPLSAGVVISVPGERLAGVSQSESFAEHWDMTSAEKLVKFANPRANVTSEGNTITVTADPPMRFIFSHIEWM